MGADIKALKNRIRSVDSTLHLTSAMGLVAASKIRRANERMLFARDYADAYRQAIAVLSACPECRRSPYAEVRATGRDAIIVIAGDRGLAGGYNANVFRLAQDYPDAEFLPIGKRACDRFGAPANSSEHFAAADAAEMARTLCERFQAGEFDRLGIIYTRYESIMTQTAMIDWLLPLIPDANAKQAGVIFEPSEAAVMDRIVPQYVAGRIMHGVRESFASEVSARRMAMDSAGKNARRMIDDMQLQYNRERQNAITQEITEIVGGSGQ